MVIDSHGHVTAPDSLYVYKAQILAHRGAHGRGGNLAVCEDYTGPFPWTGTLRRVEVDVRGPAPQDAESEVEHALRTQ